jgi:beta-lactamase regulating signal transducer with metallopeptidase domain
VDAESIARTVLRDMADAVGKGTLLLAVAGAAALLLRRGSAAHRHALWTAGVVALALLPLAHPWMPRYAVLPLPRQELAAEAPVQRADVGVVARIGELAPAMNAQIPAEPSASVHKAVALPVGRPVQWPVVIVAVWLAGVGLCLLPVVIATWRLRRWLACHTFAAPALAPHVVVQAHIDGGMRHSVPILLSNTICMPVAVGIRHPRIILPAAAAEWPLPRLRSVLLHELAHLRRGDLHTQMLATLIRAIYWFHPLVWVACRRMEIEREKACDDLVLSRGIDAQSYARTLLETATRFEGRTLMRFTAVSMARRSSLETRIRAVLHPGVRRGAMTRRALAALLVATVTLTGSIAVLSAADTPGAGQPAAALPAPVPARRILPEHAISLEAIGARPRGPFWTADGAPALPPLPQMMSSANGRILILKFHDLPAGTSFPIVHMSYHVAGQPTALEWVPTIYRILPVGDGATWVMNDTGEKQPLSPIAPSQVNVAPTDDAAGGDLFYEVVLGSTGSEKVQFSDMRDVRLQIGIAAAPWATIAEGKEPLSGKTPAGSYVTSAPTLVEPDTGSGRGGFGGGPGFGAGFGGGRRVPIPPQAAYSRVTIAHDLDNVDVRVVAIDASNQEHAMTLLGNDRQGALRQLTVGFTDLLPADIKTVRLQSRPIEWTTIEHIALNPRGASTPRNDGAPAGATPAGAPAAGDADAGADVTARLRARRDQERAVTPPTP